MEKSPFKTTGHIITKPQSEWTPTPGSDKLDRPKRLSLKLILAILLFILVVPFYAIIYFLLWLWERVVELLCLIAVIILNKFRKDDID